MAASSYIPTYHNLSVTPAGLGTFNINYVEAGSPYLPTLILLHGFPASSNQYRDFIPLLSNDYHILAPDLPGFGLTTSPPNLQYTFDNLTAAIGAWIVALQLTTYGLYIFDYGAPVGLRIAMSNPSAIKFIISQNGNAYNAGFGHPFWDPIMALWKDNSTANRDFLRENIFTLATTKYQYEAGVPPTDIPLIDPTTYNMDYLLNLAGTANQDRQLDLFYDYQNNVAEYPQFHAYFRQYQPPLLAVWGKGDPAFIPPGAEAFKQDLPNAEVTFVDAGHFALETKRWEIARIVLNFLERVGAT